MADDTSFDLTLERIALIRRMVVAWNGTEAGAPIIHPDAPYGGSDRDQDIADVTGDDDGTEEEHRAMGDALAVFVQNARLKPGRYEYHNPLTKLDLGDLLDVFRDDATGKTPEHITFAVANEHLALLPHIGVRWDGGYDVPGINPAHPYGEASAYTHDMAVHLGEPAAKDADGDAAVGEAPDARLQRLHREMQPVLQIFLRYADLGPGRYRRPAGSRGWIPA